MGTVQIDDDLMFRLNDLCGNLSISVDDFVNTQMRLALASWVSSAALREAMIEYHNRDYLNNLMSCRV